MKHHQNELEGAGKFAGQLPYGHLPPAEAMITRKSSRRGSGFRRFIAMLDNNLWLLSGMTLGITALIISWWVLSGQGPGGTRLFNDARETKTPQTSQQSDTTANRAIEQLEDRLAGLVDRTEMLTDSITYLESKLIRAHVLTDSIITAEQRSSSPASKQPVNSVSMSAVDELPPSAAGERGRQAPAGWGASRETTVSSARAATIEKSITRLPNKGLHGTPSPRADTVAGKQPNRAETLREASARAPATEYVAAVAKEQAPARTSRDGPWVINLASSPSQADADRFAEKAQTRGIETQQQQVTVKGKRYWRVQTIGFSTADAAQGYTGIVKEKLGLRDVWINRR
jgi:hypothetical protein